MITKVNPVLEPFLVELKDLVEDANNVNEHSPESIEAIASSLKQFGQQKPIVAGAGGVVKAGNGQLKAAKLLGWTHMAAVKSDLPASKLKAFAIADNHIAKLSEFNRESLNIALEEIEADGFDIKLDLAFPDIDSGSDANDNDRNDTDEKNYNLGYQLIFENAEEQEKWFKFVKFLKRKYPDTETISKRIVEFFGEYLNKGELDA